MAKNISLVAFCAMHGKAHIRPYNMNGKSWIALLCQDSEGNEVFIAPKQEDNLVVNPDTGEILVDFNKSAAEIAAAIKANLDELVVLVGNKNWDSPEEEEIPVYTLMGKYHQAEDIVLDF